MIDFTKYDGYLLLDNRAAGQPLAELATFTCSHCQRVVIKNPERTRERYHCRGCDHLLCDDCAAARAAGAKCRTFKQLADEYQEAVERGRPVSSLILLS